MPAHIRDRSLRLALLAVTPAAAALVVAGCSSTANPPAGSSTTTTKSSATTSAGAAPTTGSSGASTTASLEIGNTLNYGSMGTTAALDCATGKSLNVAGSNNTLTVTGTWADCPATETVIDADPSEMGTTFVPLIAAIVGLLLLNRACVVRSRPSPSK